MRRRYLREAAVALVLARIAIRLIPMARVLAWVGRPPRRTRRFPGDEAAWIAWAIETVGARRWMGAAALQRALAMQAMLRRRGIASRLCLGVAREDGRLTAHAWVQVGRDIVLGAAGAPRATRMAEFGGERP